ncbi:MAG: TetR/AcrR family transcriptional regulator [Desulfobulbaceae bacterium]|nr:TetR/AcrR family transcriptional regulator [Desulfobulbaceae bacterium]
MQTRGRETRSHILQESRKLFTLQGFRNTSISEIITATGVKKGNLYYHFPSKEELGLAVLVDVRDEFFTLLDHSLAGENPIVKIVNSCNTIMAMMEQNNFVGGCLFGNTALEMKDSNSRFGRIIQDVFSQWKSRVEHELRLAAGSGLLKSPMPANALATAVIATLEGGIMLSRVYKNKNGIEDCILAIRVLLEEQK